MNTARHHAEWLSLVETSGPFLSMPVLMRVFPQQLDARDTDRAARLREAYDMWLERGTRTASVHQAWVRHVLADLLEYPSDLLVEGPAMPPGLEAPIPQHAETLRPDLVLKHRDPAAKVQLLVAVYPPTQDLGKPVSGRTWNAAPGTRMMELLHATDLPLGLVTNGEQWMVVYAPRGETTGFASWFADLWMQEPVTLRAFHSLLHLRRFIGVAAGDSLAALYAESAKDQQEVTDQLGKQVRQAVEVLVQAFDRIDAASQRALLKDVAEKDLYNAALTVMMRLVFLFSAEERELLPLNDRFYEEHYAASSLRAQLRERADQYGEEVLERRNDAWSRLLATFRAVHGGVQHERMRLPAYGGSLFDPDRYPFLEGRAIDTRWRDTPARPLPINNRVVLHLLEALQELRVRVPGGPAEKRRLSFRALDIEQIGHVYEGLLDHTARRATEVILGLDGKHEPEVPLARLETLRATGTTELVEFLAEETGRSEKTLRQLVESPDLADEHKLLHACGNDPRLLARVRPFAGLLREDSFEQQVIVEPGCVFVTRGSDRRSTGTHYTPRSLTEPIVEHTLEPLVYLGPAEGRPRAEWKLKSPREILALKVCDMAMGSGAFLVQTCRYLAERLVEAWTLAEKGHPDQVIITPEGELSMAQPVERLLPVDSAERLAIARRYVADRCLYGVDINPMAVEMAKLSLWLITLQRDRPFTFLDHALKFGDSLLGLSNVHQLERFSLREADAAQPLFDTQNLWRHTQQAAELRRQLESMPTHTAALFVEKARLHGEAETLLEKLRAAADFLIAAELDCPGDRGWDTRRAVAASHMQAGWKKELPEFQRLARAELHGRRPFHWPLEFPEVFEAGKSAERLGGFDAFVGNPPFKGGLKLETLLGSDYRAYLVGRLGRGETGVRGTGDLCAYFFLRIGELTRMAGFAGLIATNTIAQGDTRRLGLDQLSAQGSTIFRAVPSRPWPGEAALEVAFVWFRKGSWEGLVVLDDLAVPGITPFLTTSSSVAGKPHRLAANLGKAFQGSNVLGTGFVLPPTEARLLIEKDPRNGRVLFPYLNGDDFNSRPDQSASRWVINFHDWALSAAEEYLDVISIIRERVKPERDRMIGRNPMATRRGTIWWRFAGEAKFLYQAISGASHVLVVGQTSKYHNFVFVPNGSVFDQKLVVFALNKLSEFSVLQSSFHGIWAIAFGSSLETRPVYTPSDCFETFPFPADAKSLESNGERYHEHRRQLMQARGEGLTKTYNRFHNPCESAADIVELRALHRQLDAAVAAAYDWTDLAANDGTALGHGFHETKHGIRYTLAAPAHRSVLDRLLALNHQRYAEEVAAGLHDKGAKKRARSTKRAKAEDAHNSPKQQELFG